MLRHVLASCACVVTLTALVDIGFGRLAITQHLLVQAQKKVRPLLHEYFRHLLYGESSATSESLVRTLRKFPWDDAEFYVSRSEWYAAVCCCLDRVS
jgi:hypothetical protein